MGKGGHGVSGHTHSQDQLDYYANQNNPNNDVYWADRDNHANQCNPNNDEYWHSGYCAAGTGYYDIELNNSLAEGDYSACLNIQCFREDGTALNGANVEFNLYVR